MLKCAIICAVIFGLAFSAPPVRDRLKAGEESEDKNKFIKAIDPAVQALNEKEGDSKKLLDVAKPPEPNQLPKPNKAVKKNPKLVRRPDHLEAVPLERDGHLNKKFRQEVFLGQDTNGDGEKVALHEMGGVDAMEDPHLFSNTKKKKEKTPEQMLIEVYHKADENGDKNLTLQELEEWIFKTALHHLDEAVDESRAIFNQIDQDSDGSLTWDEYHYHFLTDKKLMSPEKAKRHKEEDHSKLEPEDQDRIQIDLEKFQEANTDREEGLTEWEFLAFRHPEHSLKALKTMVIDIIRSLDTNMDGRLSVSEFVSAPPGEVEKGWESEERKYLNQRKQEFEEEIDTDHDGYASEKELLIYMNPRNPQHARHEARELLDLADTDLDNGLSLDEVLKHSALFFGSSLLNPSRNLHDEM